MCHVRANVCSLVLLVSLLMLCEGAPYHRRQQQQVPSFISAGASGAYQNCTHALFPLPQNVTCGSEVAYLPRCVRISQQCCPP